MEELARPTDGTRSLFYFQVRMSEVPVVLKWYRYPRLAVCVPWKIIPELRYGHF